MWAASEIEEDWVWTLLPYSKRLTIIFDAKGLAHAFNRTVCAPELKWKSSMNIPAGAIEPYTCVDCSVSVDGRIVVYDVLSKGTMSLCGLNLTERMSHIPSILPRVTYKQIGPELKEAANRMDSFKRIILVDPKVAYRPHLYSRSALSWKPAYMHNLAVLCCRGGRAMSMMREDSVFLRDEGPIDPSTNVGATFEIFTYLCLYNPQKRHWTPLRKVKRGDHLYTAEQVELVRNSEPQPHSAAIFEDLSDVTETKK